MKKVKIFMTAITVLAVVSGGLAFKVHKVSGAYLCQATSGTCTGTTKYTLDTGGTSMKCNDGNGGTSCTTTRTVSADPR